CQNNLKQLGLAMHNYHEAFGTFPYLRSAGGNDRHTWALIILPYIEQQNLYDLFKAPSLTGSGITDGFYKLTGTNPGVVTGRQTIMKIYICPTRRATPAFSPIEVTTDPAAPRGTPSDYAACIGASSASPTNGIFRGVDTNHMASGVKIVDVTDGTSNTL